MAAAAEAVWAGDKAFGVEFPTLIRSAIALLVFNLLDGLFTLTFLQMNVATEANPIMRLAYEGSPMWFMFAKLTMVNAGLWILASHARFSAARFAVHGAAVVYAAIVAYHLTFLVRLVT